MTYWLPAIPRRVRPSRAGAAWFDSQQRSIECTTARRRHRTGMPDPRRTADQALVEPTHTGHGTGVDSQFEHIGTRVMSVSIKRRQPCTEFVAIQFGEQRFLALARLRKYPCVCGGNQAAAPVETIAIGRASCRGRG